MLKIISQTIDPSASQLITDTLFDPKQTVLEDILVDPTAGISFISKLVSSRPDPRDRARMSERVKSAMAVLQVQVSSADELC